MTGQPAWSRNAALTQAMLASMRGEIDAALEVAAVERRLLVGESRLRPMVELAHGVALLGVDHWEDGYAILVRLAHRTTVCPELLTAGLLGHLADAALRTRHVQDGRALVSLVAGRSPACARGAELADLLYATAVLAPEDTSEACFATLQCLDPGRWPWVRARGDLAWGTWLRRARRISQARAYLLSAERLFAALDAPAWQRRVRHELRAAGVRTASTLAGGDDDVAARLSPQELEIVRLAAQGLSNRQIGDRLFLSPRTIGSHLYRSFPKLDVTSRRQLIGLDLPA